MLQEILDGGVFARGVGGKGNLFGGVLGGSGGGSILNLPLWFRWSRRSVVGICLIRDDQTVRFGDEVAIKGMKEAL